MLNIRVQDDFKKSSTQDVSVKRYLKELQRYPPMTRKEEGQIFHRARKGDQKAIERLITSNLRFVVKVAFAYQGRGVALSDLIAEGNIGLMEALHRFDEKRGYKFISYAVWWIRQAIFKSLNQTSSVLMPSNRKDDMDRMARNWGQITQELGRIPTIEEVASDLNFSRKRAERAFHCVRNDLSLESPLNVFGGQTLTHVLEAENTDPDKLVLGRNQSELVNESLNSSLNEREAPVIMAYFGLDGQERLTLEKIGLTLGVTRERVRQIRNQALRKLRRFFKKRVPGGNCDDIF